MSTNLNILLKIVPHLGDGYRCSSVLLDDYLHAVIQPVLYHIRLSLTQAEQQQRQTHHQSLHRDLPVFVIRNGLKPLGYTTPP